MGLSSSAPPAGRPASSATTTRLAHLLKEEGFENFGFVALTTPVSIAIYEEWLAAGRHGGMTYLERHLPEKRDPSRLLGRARTAIVVTKNYVPHPEPDEQFPIGRATRVAAYARGRDYHHFLVNRLQRVARVLKDMHPEEEFLVFTDSGPVLERDLAQRAGLGWVGKNTCLIHPRHGSLFFIAEIYTTLDLPTARIEQPDHCGTCTRCLDACPTGALVAPRQLDARLCISYLTIEARGLPPKELRPAMGDWLFGCDICQTVCPWNLKVHGKETIAALAPPPTPDSRQELIHDLRYLLTSSNRALERAFAGTPLLRAGATHLKRNAIVVAANRGLVELRGEIEALTEHEKLGELARWALEVLGWNTSQ